MILESKVIIIKLVVSTLKVSIGMIGMLSGLIENHSCIMHIRKAKIMEVLLGK